MAHLFGWQFDVGHQLELSEGWGSGSSLYGPLHIKVSGFKEKVSQENQENKAFLKITYTWKSHSLCYILWEGSHKGLPVSKVEGQRYFHLLEGFSISLQMEHGGWSLLWYWYSEYTIHYRTYPDFSSCIIQVVCWCFLHHFFLTSICFGGCLLLYRAQ